MIRFSIIATIEDESEPSELTINWRVISGTGEVTFEDAQAATTTIRVTKEGDYVLELSVSDGEHTTTETVTLQVIVKTGGTNLTFKIFTPLVQR